MLSFYFGLKSLVKPSLRALSVEPSTLTCDTCKALGEVFSSLVLCSYHNSASPLVKVNTPIPVRQVSILLQAKTCPFYMITQIDGIFLF